MAAKIGPSRGERNQAGHGNPAGERGVPVVRHELTDDPADPAPIHPEAPGSGRPPPLRPPGGAVGGSSLAHPPQVGRPLHHRVHGAPGPGRGDPRRISRPRSPLASPGFCPPSSGAGRPGGRGRPLQGARRGGLGGRGRGGPIPGRDPPATWARPGTGRPSGRRGVYLGRTGTRNPGAEHPHPAAGPEPLPLPGPFLRPEGPGAPLARRLEFFLSKDRILELYLNVVELGPGIFGVEAASPDVFPALGPGADPVPGGSPGRHPPPPPHLEPRPQVPGRMAWRRDLILGRLAGGDPVPIPPPEVPGWNHRSSPPSRYLDGPTRTDRADTGHPTGHPLGHAPAGHDSPGIHPPGRSQSPLTPRTEQRPPGQPLAGPNREVSPSSRQRSMGRGRASIRPVSRWKIHP
jgi:hypothetical protein